MDQGVDHANCDTENLRRETQEVSEVCADIVDHLNLITRKRKDIHYTLFLEISK